jgi:hypothetical protein
MSSYIRKLPSSVTLPYILPLSSTTFENPKSVIPSQENKRSRSKVMHMQHMSSLGQTSFHCIWPRTSRPDANKIKLDVRKNMKTRLFGYIPRERNQEETNLSRHQCAGPNFESLERRTLTRPLDNKDKWYLNPLNSTYSTCGKRGPRRTASLWHCIRCLLVLDNLTKYLVTPTCFSFPI